MRFPFRGFTPAAAVAACWFASIRQDQPIEPVNAADARYRAVAKIWELVELHGRWGADEFPAPELEARYLWSLRLAEAAIAAGKQSPNEALAEHADRMQERTTLTKGLRDRGRAGSLEIASTEYYVADAKMRLDLAPR